MDRKQHSINETDILFFLTNTPSPQLQKIANIASNHGKVTIIYWKRAANTYNITLNNKILERPVLSSFSNNKGLFRMIASLIFLIKILPVLLRINHVKKIYVNYLDVLLVTCLLFRKQNFKLLYNVRDLSNLQYGGIPLLNKVVLYVEKILLKRVSTLLLTSPFFWSEYYEGIYSGSYILIENLPSSKIWQHFDRRKDNDVCIVGFFGSIRYYKSLECLLIAVKELREVGYNIRVFIAGTGPDEKKLLKTSSGMDFVSFYGPYEYDKEILRLYGQVNVVYSVYDTTRANVKIALPNKFYECIICGLPIIVAKETMLERYVKKYSSGYSVTCLSVEDLKKVLISYMNRDNKSLQIRNFSNKINKEDFFYEKYFTQLSDLFTFKD